MYGDVVVVLGGHRLRAARWKTEEVSDLIKRETGAPVPSSAVSAGIHQSVEGANAASLRGLSRVLYWRSFVNLALMFTDAAMFLVAGATVLNIRHENGELYSLRYGWDVDITFYLLAMSVVWVLCLRGVGLYHRHVMGDGYQVNPLLLKGAFFCWTFQCALCFILNLTLTLSSVTIVSLLTWVLTMFARVLTRLFITRSRRKGVYSYGTVVVGSSAGIGRALQFLNQRSQLNYRPIAVCPIRLNPQTGVVEADPDLSTLRAYMHIHGDDHMPVLQYSSNLGSAVVDAQAQTVMVCDVIKRFSDAFDTFAVTMESLGLEVALITSAADVAGHETQVRQIQGTTVITLRLPQYSAGTRFIKRVFDLIVSSLAIVLSLIITIPVAIAIKLEDGGPVFYRQKRIGLRGRPFEMIKFRSMVTNADALKAKLAQETGQENRFIFKMKNDPRITKVGHFIRRFSIDELPQFLNVFIGDMSVVGPRPPLPEEYARYNKLYATRMLVKPGITGPWQVSGRSDLSAEESEALDVAYVQNWSVLGDFVLMFRTVGAVLSHKGAY